MESTVGARLKNLRLEKGLTLEEVHKKTKIHLSILKSIEEDNLLNFSPIYKKGFLKIYCKFLEVDPRECIPGYKEPSSKVEYVSNSLNKPLSLWKVRPLNLSFLKALRVNPKVIFVIISIIVFIIILFNAGKIFSFKRRLAPKKAAVLPAVTSAAKTQETIAVKIIRLDIYAKENCFIQLKADGKVVFQNILRKGRSESWQATSKIEMSVGNAGALELEVNGKRISSLGRRGQALKNILITKEGLSVKQ